MIRSSSAWVLLLKTRSLTGGGTILGKLVTGESSLSPHWFPVFFTLPSACSHQLSTLGSALPCTSPEAMEPHDCRMFMLGILLRQETAEQHYWRLRPQIQYCAGGQHHLRDATVKSLILQTLRIYLKLLSPACFFKHSFTKHTLNACFLVGTVGPDQNRIGRLLLQVSILGFEDRIMSITDTHIAYVKSRHT